MDNPTKDMECHLKLGILMLDLQLILDLMVNSQEQPEIIQLLTIRMVVPDLLSPLKVNSKAPLHLAA